MIWLTDGQMLRPARKVVGVAKRRVFTAELLAQNQRLEKECA